MKKPGKQNSSIIHRRGKLDMKKLCMMIIVLLLVPAVGMGCLDDGPGQDPPPRDYRDDMRNFVQNISVYGKERSPDFVIIPQNGHSLLTGNGEQNGSLPRSYLEAIDGVGREDLFYGYEEDDVPTPAAEREEMAAFMDIAKSNGVQVLVTDYCQTESHVNDSYQQNEDRGYLSFAADHRELDNIPAYPGEPYNVNDSNITSLGEAQNFLYLINPDSFEDKNAFLDAVRDTNYDAVIMDLFYGNTNLTAEEINSLKIKKNGGSRLVIAYMSIGEAEDYRYYWQEGWEEKPPSWFAGENPKWKGNYKVRYWDKAWQDVIYGGEGAYLDLILAAGFDGVYLDIIDAYEYFEDL